MKIALADDHSLYRKSIAALLEDMPETELIFQAENGQDLLAKLAEEPVNLVLLDLEMPVMDGISTLPRIKSQYPTTKVAIISLHGDKDLISHLKELGADGFIPKDADFEEWEKAINEIFATGSFFEN